MTARTVVLVRVLNKIAVKINLHAKNNMMVHSNAPPLVVRQDLFPQPVRHPATLAEAELIKTAPTTQPVWNATEEAFKQEPALQLAICALEALIKI